jgi:predicted permease
MRFPRGLFGNRRRDEGDFADEIAAHLALEAERLTADGLSPRDAVLEARRRFGNVGTVKERFHETQNVALWEAATRQLRSAARRLRRAPAFSATAALTLMLGIGATTAVFSLVDAVLLRPLPFPHPERLVDLSHTMTLQGVTNIDQSDATYLYYGAANHSFSSIGAYQSTAVNLSATGAGDLAHAQRVQAARASASIFGLLQVPTLHGRAFGAAEDLPSAAPVVVLGERLWRSQYGADPRMLGRSLLIDGVAHTVIGIMPERFAFPDDGTQLWLPIGIDPARTESATFDLHAIGRLRDGVDVQTAANDLMKLLPLVPEAYPGRLSAQAIAITKMRPVVRPLAAAVVGNAGRTLWVVFGAAGFLLLIACANVANLFLVRAEERQHELAVRRALGAGRGTITAEFFAEAAMIGGTGAVLGIALAALALYALRAGGPALSIPRVRGVGLDGAVLLAALAATLLTVLLVSIVPAMRFAGTSSVTVVNQSARGTTSGRSRHRVRRVLVVAQVALALVLVAGAGLMARSFSALRAISPGFDPAGAFTFRMALPQAEYPSSASAYALIASALNAITEIPGVGSAGVVSRIPLDSEARQDSGTWVEDRLPAPGKLPNVHQVAFASPGVFSALGVPLIQGHEFKSLDPMHPAAEAIVTRALAQRYWSDSLAIGRHIGFSPAGPWFTVVGVTGDIRGSGVDQPPDETVYLPLTVLLGGGIGMGSGGTGAATLWTPRNVAFVIRGAPGRDVPSASVTRAVAALAPTVPVYKGRDLAGVLARSTARTAFTAELLELASVVALLIGAVGLYGMMTYVVGLRRKELAVRVALGASPAGLRRAVVREATVVSAIGIVLGIAGAVLLMRFMTAMLFGVAPDDPVTLSAAAVLMFVVAVAASWIPAGRAAAVAPADVLRMDA